MKREFMHLLQNTVRPYPWGSTSAIAELFGRDPSGEPEAEVWIGAHPDSPSKVSTADGETISLDTLIASDPRRMLGTEVDRRFGGRLPFLMKVLAADSPLSLQVHPSLKQAAAGYAAENAHGIPSDATNRNYKDANHKPEMIFALTRFEALCGFRPAEEASEAFLQLSQLLPARSPEAQLLAVIAAELLGEPVSDGLRTAFSRLFSERDLVSRAVGSLAVLNVPGSSAAGELRTVAELHQEYPGDPGALVALLLNRLVLEPGESLYLPAGNIHAYLKGLGIEVMASSDNVLRGGLTPKHVDIPELLKTVLFESIDPPSLTMEPTPGPELYCPPFDEFQLQRLELTAADADLPLIQNGPAIVLAVSGGITLQSTETTLTLRRGESAFVPANQAPVMVRNEKCADPNAVAAVAFAVTVASDLSG
jgi:mannose-6-phosphate isomerase